MMAGPVSKLEVEPDTEHKWYIINCATGLEMTVIKSWISYAEGESLHTTLRQKYITHVCHKTEGYNLAKAHSTSRRDTARHARRLTCPYPHPHTPTHPPTYLPLQVKKLLHLKIERHDLQADVPQVVVPTQTLSRTRGKNVYTTVRVAWTETC